VTTYALLLLLVIGDGDAKSTELSRHETRQACAVAAHAERVKPWPDKATVRILLCREVVKEAKGGN